MAIGPHKNYADWSKKHRHKGQEKLCV